MTSIKVIHDRERCIGCRSCVTIAPQNWVMDGSDGKSRLAGARKRRNLFVAEIFECDWEANQKAAEACPMNCIRLEG